PSASAAVSDGRSASLQERLARLPYWLIPMHDRITTPSCPNLIASEIKAKSDPDPVHVRFDADRVGIRKELCWMYQGSEAEIYMTEFLAALKDTTCGWRRARLAILIEPSRLVK
ncbi:hypothetical protein BVRB_040540, partial [Beta vulgaris subsp. vulgaris]